MVWTEAQSLILLTQMKQCDGTAMNLDFRFIDKEMEKRWFANIGKENHNEMDCY